MITKRNVLYEIMFTVGNELGLWLQLKRESLGLSQAQLAKKAGLNRAVINKIENGNVEPKISTLEAIAKALNIPVEQIVRVALSKKLPNVNEIVEETTNILLQLSEEDQIEMRELARFKFEHKEKKRKSRIKPPAQMLLNRE